MFLKVITFCRHNLKNKHAIALMVDINRVIACYDLKESNYDSLYILLMECERKYTLLPVSQNDKYVHNQLSNVAWLYFKTACHEIIKTAIKGHSDYF